MKAAAKWMVIVAVTVLAALSLQLLVNAAPQAPGSLTATHYRRDNFASASTVPAYAGNVTELDITNEQLTKGWQGYYGDISGTIVLDDANNMSMFTWVLSEDGEVYATWNATSPSWTSLECLNFSGADTEASRLNILGSYDDNFTNTFNQLNSHPGFNVSTLGFEPNLCNFTVQTYVNDSAPDGNPPRVFNETVLYDPNGDFVVYMAIVNQNQYGFDNATHDFQIIVPEDGWDENTDSTSYYFYVELE